MLKGVEYHELNSLDEIRRVNLETKDGRGPDKLILLTEAGYFLLVKASSKNGRRALHNGPPAWTPLRRRLSHGRGAGARASGVGMDAGKLLVIFGATMAVVAVVAIIYVLAVMIFGGRDGRED